MVIDTSAIMAILLAEPAAVEIAQAIEADVVRLLSAASLLECAIVIESRHGLAGSEKLDELLGAAAVSIEPVTAEQIALARLAYRQYGKGRHKASLNFGDCFSYALAKINQEPLLCTGDDFRHTDLTVVPIP